MHPRQRQLSLYYNQQATIAQDQNLIDFCIEQQVKQLTLMGDPDSGYFSQRLPDCTVRNHVFRDKFMLAWLLPNPGIVLEKFIKDLQRISVQHMPAWIYVAINKYTVTTRQTWPDLTDDYDQDLLNIVAKTLPDYTELKRHSCLDQGQYFNFVHPTTYVYFQRS
jgi:hypothetical protein